MRSGARAAFTAGVAFALGLSARWIAGARVDRVVDVARARLLPGAPPDPGRSAFQEYAAVRGSAQGAHDVSRLRALRIAWIARNPSSWCALDLVLAQARDDAVAGDLEKAASLVAAALADATPAAKARGHALVAGLAREGGAFTRARDLSRVALSLAPYDRLRCEIALGLGDLEVKLGRDDDARRAYGLVLARSPQPAKRLAAGLAIGWSWLRARRPDEGAACFSAGLSAAAPRDEAPWRWGLAHAAHARGDAATARDQLERLALSPTAGEWAARARAALAAWPITDPR